MNYNFQAMFPETQKAHGAHGLPNESTAFKENNGMSSYWHGPHSLQIYTINRKNDTSQIKGIGWCIHDKNVKTPKIIYSRKTPLETKTIATLGEQNE